MPDFVRLCVKGLYEMWMGVPQRCDGYPTRVVEIASAAAVKEKGALAPHEGQFAAGIGRKKSRHESSVFLKQKRRQLAAASDVKVLGLRTI